MDYKSIHPHYAVISWLMIDFNETNKTATEVSLLRSGKAISFNQEDGTVKFTVPELKDFEVVAMR